MSGMLLLDNWSPPDGAGEAVACLATSFTFEADFFTQDCLSRFLSLSRAQGEGDHISDLAALLEEEDRLSEAQVTVLVDRSTPAEKRNLRWDLIPISAPGGLLHAKVAVLIWERAARIILGSANLTSAGYRRQIEIALAFDLDANCSVPRSVVDDLVTVLGSYVDLAPGPDTGAKLRARSTLRLLEERASTLALPTSQHPKLRLALAPSRPGQSPIALWERVWSGPRPLHATALSPFWDGQAGRGAIERIEAQRTGRPAADRTTTIVLGSDRNGTVQAPAHLGDGNRRLFEFKDPDDEPRLLHAKVLTFESDQWLAVMVGSSNATRQGLGLDPTRGHEEINLWIGVPRQSKDAKTLRKLISLGDRLDPATLQYEEGQDEDEPATPPLPGGFLDCTIDVGPPVQVALRFDPRALPPAWSVRTPLGQVVATHDLAVQLQADAPIVVPLDENVLPSYLDVIWEVDGLTEHATWTANVDDRGALPAPDELASLPVDLILAALASSRPLPDAVEHELRQRSRSAGGHTTPDLNPLNRFDDSGLLLQRARRFSVSLWNLEQRLQRPTANADALRWRLEGPFGPLALVDGLVEQATTDVAVEGEAQFLLAEMAMTVDAIDWANTYPADPAFARKLAAQVLADLASRRADLTTDPVANLDEYLDDVFSRALR